MESNVFDSGQLFRPLLSHQWKQFLHRLHLDQAAHVEHISLQEQENQCILFTDNHRPQVQKIMAELLHLLGKLYHITDARVAFWITKLNTVDFHNIGAKREN